MPEYTVTGKWKMHWLNRAVYDNLPAIDPYALYWIKDQNIVFRGNKPLLDNFAQVEEFVTPYVGSIKPKTLCFKLSDVEGEPYFEARVLNTDYTWSVVVPPVYGFIEKEGTEDKTLPTRNAVRTFVTDRLDELREYFDALNNSMTEKLEQAQQAATIATDAATDANASANDSFVSAIKSESYAVGGTDSRPGENTDNAKWYKEQAEAAAEQGGGSAEEAKQYAEAAAQSASEALDSEHNAATSESNAAASERAAAQSEANAAASEAAAQLSEQHAATSESNAHDSEVAAKASEDAAALSEQHAATSESNAHDSEVAAKQSEQAAASSESNAHDSEVAAKASENAAAASESAAHTSEVNAKASEDAAKLSEQNAAQSESNASTSETNAHNSEVAAASSESNAHDSEVAAAASAAAALTSEGKAKQSEINAANSATDASGSATNASNSATAAHNSEVAANNSKVAAAASANAALSSEGKAKTSEQNAAASESAAAGSASAAEQAAISAYNSANSASGSATAAHTSEVNAKASETKVEQDASEAASSAAAAEQSEQDAAAKAVLAESWAVGGTGTRTGEDTNNAEYWAEQARQASPDGKADKVLNAVEGDLAGLDSTGNLTDSGIPADNVAQQDGWYDDLHSGTAGNLVDPRAPSTERKFGFDTSCGNVSISDDGTADPTLIKGTTYVKNQLIGDSKVIKELGQGVVTSPYAVSGDIDHAYIKGRSLVKNQIVPASVEKEGSSSNGVVEVMDAVAGNALALNMVAPRSVVVNQLIRASSSWALADAFTDIINNSTVTKNNNSIKIVGTNSETITSRLWLNLWAVPLVSGHVYAFYGNVKCTEMDNVYLSFHVGTTYYNVASNISTWNFTKYTSPVTSPDANFHFYNLSGNHSFPAGWSFEAELYACDLTQYFNGNQTLIDSITSLDDLIAYDSRFAQYEAYNTGTVTGVQPQVKVTGKNLFDKDAWQTITYNRTGDTINGQSKLINGCYVSAGQTITISLDISGTAPEWVYSGFRINGYDYIMPEVSNASNSYFPTTDHWTENGVKTITFTRTGFFYIYKRSGNFASANEANASLPNIQIELGSTATTYEPYHDGGTAQAPAPLFAVGNAADEFEAVSGVTARKVASVDLGTLNWSKYIEPTEQTPYGYCSCSVPGKKPGYINVICGTYVTKSSAMTDRVIYGLSGGNDGCVIIDSSFIGKTGAQIAAALSGKLLYYELATPTTSQSTPTQISLQTGINNAIQTDGGITLSSLDLGYDGTSFDVPLTSGRTYITNINGESSVVTDGTTQHVTGGVDMIVDLTMLYNGVLSLITPITTWDALVADTGMYKNYTSYNVGEVVSNSSTSIASCGKNLYNKDAWQTITIVNGGGLSAQDGKQRLVNGFYGKAGKTYRITIDIANSTLRQYVYMAGRINGFDYGITRLSNASSPYFPTTNRFENSGVRTITLTADAYVYFYAYADGSNFSDATDGNTCLANVQIEEGSVSTEYEAYYNGGTATAGLLKGIPGSVYDQLDVVTGKFTTRIGSYTFTGNETWQTSSGGSNMFYTKAITDAYRTPSTASIVSYLLAGYKASVGVSSTSPDLSFSLNSAAQSSSSNIFFVRDTSCADTTAIQVKMTGKTVYYRLATYTSSTTTAQPLTQSTGNLTVFQTAGTLPVKLDIRHAVSEWDEPIVRSCKYIFRDNGEDSLVTGSTTVTYKHVVGGQHKLINLTQWFGYTREPSIANFYKLFPTWKGADIPYDGGTILNYKGTGVRTIGFNAYNNTTGTAILLGGNQYQICGTYTSVSYEDQWGNSEEITPDQDGLFTPINNGTLTVVGGNDTDTCVHLTWSGYKNFGKEDYEYLPYEEKGVTWDLSQYFPNGMNGIGDVTDDITNTSATTNWGIKVFDGTENWSTYYKNGFSVDIIGMKSGNNQEGACNFIQAFAGNIELLAGASAVRLGANDSMVYYWNVLDESAIETVDDWKAYLAELYAAGTPLILIYPLAAPTTTTVTPTKNFSYPVNDFGTEQSLPVNTLTLTTTDLDAEIRYSLDFTRTVQHYSEIEDDVEQLVEEKDNLARQDGNYADKGGTYTYATQLKDPNAQPVEASYGNRTSAGDVSIADNGTGDVTSLQGTTQIQNQLVHDTNMNDKSSTDGKLVITDAVGGDVTNLLLKGGAVVHNQLVQDSVEKTVTGTGRLGVEDGVAGNANSFVITAPRSVVMNQLVKPSDINTENSSTGVLKVENAVVDDALALKMVAPRSVVVNQLVDWESTVGSTGGGAYGTTSKDAANKTVTLTIVQLNSSNGVYFTIANNMPKDHVFLASGYATASSAIRMQALYSQIAYEDYADIEANMRTFFSLRVIAKQDIQRFALYCGNVTVGGTFKLENVQLVDITQYFNGDQTLINSITSWEDLMAYDSRFAQYVTYNTGTVEGVQPQVKVSGKNLVDQSVWQLKANVDGSDFYGYNSIPIHAGMSLHVKFTPGSTIVNYIYMRITDLAGNVQAVRNVTNLNDAYITTDILVRSDFTITFNSTCKDGYFYIWNRGNGGSAGQASHSSVNAYLQNLQIELGSTSTSYESYHDGGTAQAPVPLFAVGNAEDEFEVVAGVTTHKMASVDLGTLTYSDYAATDTSHPYGYTTFRISAKKAGLNNLITSSYQLASASDGLFSKDKSVVGMQDSTYCYIIDSSLIGMTGAQIKNALLGKTIYYELATPTTSQSTPTQISLQAGSNTAMQTDGGRTLADLSMDYNSTIYNRELESTHVYLHKHGDTSTKISNQSSVVVDASSDQLVDLTFYLKGNMNFINPINTWDDLIAYDSSFASNVAYNIGTIQGVQPTVKVNHTTDIACPIELFAMGNMGDLNLIAADTFDAVSGVYTKTCFLADSTVLSGIAWSSDIATSSGFIRFVGNTGNSFPLKHTGTTDIISNRFMTSTTALPSDGSLTDELISGNNSYTSIYVNIKASRLTGDLTTAAGRRAAFQNWITANNMTVLYRMDTSTTSTYTPTTVPVVNVYNNALQTVGSRQCSLAFTYQGKDQTIPLNTLHKYVFCDNEEEYSVITNTASINATGGEDQLIDITQFYNGDTNKINQITSYGSLSARYPRYRDFQPYNPGTVEPVTATAKVFPDEYAYGVLYDPNQTSPACHRVELHNGVITEVNSFSSMPCHQLYRCVMDDLSTRHINYYLDDEDSTKKYNGTRNGVTSDGSASVLTGADGDVMVEIPVSYWYLDEDYNGTGKYLWLISDRPFMGTHNPAEIHDYFFVSPNGDTARTQYVGAYRASICDENGLPLNTTEGALTQTTGTSTTNKARSIAGALPFVSIDQGTLLTKASRNGASTVNTKFHQWLFLLMTIEKATLNTQLISSGYSGGIQNAFCFWRKSGRVNNGNGTGSISAVQGTQDMDNFQSINLGSTKLQRDTLMDENGRYAWSVYNRTASSTRYFTDSATPFNGNPIYTASTGSATAGTVSSATVQPSRVIQFQYRGIENPFGEVFEFEHGIQKYMIGYVKSFRGTDNLTYTRDVINDGPSSRAWVNNGTVRWTTTGSLTTSTYLYSDPELTTATTVKYKDTPSYRYTSEGYWETLGTSNYTNTAQRTATTPTYTDKHKHWPLTGYDTAFDPVTFFYRKTGSTGSSAKYIPDYYYNDGTTGDRVVYRGGYAYTGAYDGLGYVYVHYGLTYSNVSISGRLSA